MIKEQIKNLIQKIAEIDDFSVEIPEEKAHGDYATNVALILAKKQGKNPVDAAKELVLKLKIKNLKFLDHVEVINGFINFFLKSEFLQKQVKEILKQDTNFGKQNIGKNKTVIIDYSSPNIAKPMHVGHLRSTFIGQAIYNIYKFLDYKVIGDNHLGDWGTQFGIMIAAVKKYNINIGKITIQQMLDAYIRFNKETKAEEARNINYAMDFARDQFKALEDKKHIDHDKNKKIWQKLKEKSLEEFNKIYKILGIKFDEYKGESYYEPILKDVIRDCEKKLGGSGGKYFLSIGAYLINLDEFNLNPLLIKKADGATLYATRELATIKDRVKTKPEKIIYVVGNEQTLHFQQVFQAAELLGYTLKDKLIHVKFGLVLDENRQKLSTRAGRVIDAEELINKAIDLAEKIIKEKNPKLPDKEREKAARIIGVGALKYNDLSQNRQSDIVFDWDKMLSFEGNSGPYLQYSYVRLRSILRKAALSSDRVPRRMTGQILSLLENPSEIEILKELIKFPEIVQEAGEKFQINFLANYLYNLAGIVNTFYEKFSVLKAEKGLKEARLALIKSAAMVLRNGLNLLGIEVLEKM